MKKSLDDLFEEARIGPVEYEGLAVHRIVTRKVYKPGQFIIRFLKAAPYPIQGLRINIEPGKLFIEDDTYTRVLLRLDIITDDVLVKYQPSSKGSEIVFYNGWMYENEVLHAWFNNSGMLVEEQGNKLILHCSDGYGDYYREPSFDDLIVEIDFLND